MSAPQGNRFWQARSSHGRKPIFASPDDIWSAAVEYFEWVEANPLFQDQLVTFQGRATHEPLAKMRAMSIAGLCNFLDLGRRTWDEYRSREDFLPVVTRVEEVIYQQKFEGASADLLNPSIIARDLGLADRKELTGKDGKPIETHTRLTAMTDEDLERIAAGGA